MKHFFFIIFTCVSVRDEGFQYRALRRTQQRYLGLFLFTSNIPNEYNVRGQRGGVIFARTLFVIRGIKVVVGRLLLRWMQKMDFAIQYKLLLLWREYVGYLSFGDAGFNITDCEIMWMQQERFNPVRQHKEVK